MPKFSVIIPTFNRAAFITKAVDSVLHQSFKDFEVIVVDDGSTDATGAALEPYQENIQYLYQENRGVSAARNAGIHQSNGDWIAFLDSDDEWSRDYLSTQSEHIAKFPLAVAHITGAVTVFQDGKRSEHFHEINFLREFGPKECLVIERPFRAIIDQSRKWYLQPTVIRRNILLKTGLFKTHLSIAEDLDVISRSALMGPFSFCRQIQVEIYRRREAIENLALQHFKKGLYTRHAFGEVYESLLSLDLTHSERRATAEALSQNLRAMGNLRLREGKRSDARKSYGRACSLRPSIRSAIKYFSTYLPSQTWDLFDRKGKHILPGEEG